MRINLNHEANPKKTTALPLIEISVAVAKDFVGKLIERRAVRI